MASYSISNHKLIYNSDFSTLYVKLNNNTLVETYDLSSAHRLECISGNYDITATTIGTGLYGQPFNAGDSDHWEIAANSKDHLGITDLRVERRSLFTYDLEACYVKLKFEDGKLTVYSPCTGYCSEPSSTCCTIVELP
jgi:hypothetical protein